MQTNFDFLPWKNLYVQMSKQAIIDWQTMCRFEKSNIDGDAKKRLRKGKDKIIKFFKSELYSNILEINVEPIIQQLLNYEKSCKGYNKLPVTFQAQLYSLTRYRKPQQRKEVKKNVSQ